MGRRRDWLRRILEEMIRRIGWEREEEEVREGTRREEGMKTRVGRRLESRRRGNMVCRDEIGKKKMIRGGEQQKKGEEISAGRG